jgi:glyoxylase-like metal-dependent hydrolase (beta-lactamase superfamily II)
MKLINIGNRFINNYIIQTETGLMVVDTGYEGGFDQFAHRFTTAGLSFIDVKFIFLTHAHDDHTGFLNELAQNTDAPIIMHKQAVERLKAGQNSFDGGFPTKTAFIFGKIMALAGKGEHRFPPVDLYEKYLIFENNEQYLKESNIDAQIISLPGHTSDSIGLLLSDGKLLCGDAAMNGFPSIRRQSVWIENGSDYLKSWDTMIKLKPTQIYPSHGRPFAARDLEKYINSIR